MLTRNNARGNIKPVWILMATWGQQKQAVNAT